MTLIVKNIQRFDNVDFEEYNKWPEWSHSNLKRHVSGMTEKFDATRPMRIGSLVDGIMMQPDSVDMKDEDYPLAVKSAKVLREVFSRSITKQLDSQTSYKAEIVDTETGLILAVKNRPDWSLPPHMVIDLKTSSASNVELAYTHFGYKNQLWLQAQVCKCNASYILWVNPKTKRVSLRGYTLEINPEFWREAVMNFGKIPQEK